MLRADRITPRIIDAFAETGLVRAFIGLELGTPDEARRFGRRPVTEETLALLTQCQRLGVATISNLMLVHPFATLETVERGLDLLDRLPAGLVEISRMMLYHGTRLHDQLRDTGRLSGNPLRYDYTMPDDAMTRFSSMAAALRFSAFHDHSVAHRAHDVALHAALHAKLQGERSVSMMHRLESMADTVRTGYVAAYREALNLAKQGAPDDALTRLIHRVVERLNPVEATLDALAAELMAAHPKRYWLNPFRIAAASSMLTFVMVGQSGCTRSNAIDHERKTDAGVQSTDDTAENGTASADATDTSDDCPTDGAEQSVIAVEQAVEEAVPCFTGYVRKLPDAGFEAHYVQPPGISAQYVAPCIMYSEFESSPSVESWEAQAIDVAAKVDSRCFPEKLTAVPRGEDVANQTEAIRNAIETGCGESWREEAFLVELDSDGRVVDVKPQDVGVTPPPESLLSCIQSVLDGLSFPCFADMTLCRISIIVE